MNETHNQNHSLDKEWTKNKIVMKQEIELRITDPNVTSVKMIPCVPVIVLLFKSVYFKKK